MELRTLRLFLAVAEERHFGRAAARSHIAQPALSQQIKALEEELGVRLFDRSTRRVEVTGAGERFVEHARRIVESADRAVTDMCAFADGRSGRVSVGFVGTATYDVLPKLAHRGRAELPDVDLQLRGELLTPQLVDGLHSGEYDLALVRPSTRADVGMRGAELVFETLRTEELLAVLPVAHPLAAHDTVDLAELAGQTFVAHPSGLRSEMHRRVLNACARVGFTPMVLEVSETATLAVSVAAGLGVALAPEPVRSLGIDGVVYRRLASPETVDLQLARRRTDAAPAVAAVADLIRTVVGAGGS
jgi:DNA-binding transcriptional LysR family regulator